MATRYMIRMQNVAAEQKRSNGLLYRVSNTDWIGVELIPYVRNNKFPENVY